MILKIGANLPIKVTDFREGASYFRHFFLCDIGKRPATYIDASMHGKE